MAERPDPPPGDPPPRCRPRPTAARRRWLLQREIARRWLQLTDDAEYLEGLMEDAPRGLFRAAALTSLTGVVDELVTSRPKMPASPLVRRKKGGSRG